MSQKNKRARLADALLHLESEVKAPASGSHQADLMGGQAPQGIVATALDMHREGLKERLAVLEDQAAKARARGDLLEEIAPELIDDILPSDRHHSFRDDEALDELTRSIEINGQHVPILARRHSTIAGRFEIAAGRRRLEACRRLQKPVLARVLPLDDASMLDLQYRENAERSDVTVFERSLWFLAVQEQIKASTTALAKRFELSQPMMVEYLKLARLPKGLIDRLDDPRDLTIAQSKKLHAALNARRHAEKLMIQALDILGPGQGTKIQIAKALSALTQDAQKTPVKAPIRVVKTAEGRALLTITQSGRQTVFRWAPETDEALIAEIADAIPEMVAKQTKA